MSSKVGDSLGENTVHEFKEQIRKWFNIGSAEPGKKMSAARMLRQLESMNPYRYDLPTENQIQQVVTKLSGDEKKARKKAASERVVNGAAPKTTENLKDVVNHGAEEDVGNGSNVHVISSVTSGEREEDMVREGSRAGTVPNSTCMSKGRERTNNGGSEGGSVLVIQSQGATSGEVAERDTGHIAVDNTVIRQNENVVITVVPSVKRYTMPDAYAHLLKDIVVRQSTIKPALVRGKMFQRLGYCEDSAPAMFPTSEQIRKKKISFKYEYK